MPRPSATRLALLSTLALLAASGLLSHSSVSAAQTGEDAQRLECGQETSLRSIEGVTATTVHFYNQTDWDLDMYWLDYGGQRQYWGTLSRGQSFDQSTYVSHPWLVLTPEGACLGVFLPAPTPSSVVLR
jgi:von Hippel-Lindau disease tumor supressor